MKRAIAPICFGLLFAGCAPMVPPTTARPEFAEDGALRDRVDRLEKLAAALEQENRLLKDRNAVRNPASTPDVLSQASTRTDLSDQRDLRGRMHKLETLIAALRRENELLKEQLKKKTPDNG
jgi:hypothetical protein